LAVNAPDTEVGNLPRRTGHHGRVPEVDDDQLAALRRLRAAFGPIQLIKVISNHPGDDLAAPQGEPMKETRMAADPRRMTPEEHGEAHALLVTAVSDPDWQAARQALEELLRKLLVSTSCWRPRSASPTASHRPSRRNGCTCEAFYLVTGPTVRAVSRLAPRREPPALVCRQPRA
jgi:hypothetical protein